MLSLIVAMPGRALAAPAAQATAEAELLAYFESDVIEAEDTDVVVGLSFYEDETFELTLTFLATEETSAASGTYEETDDGVLLTVTSADGEELDDAVEVELAWDADDTLVILGGTDAPLGEEDIVLYPVDLEADDTGDDTGDDIIGGLEDDLDDSFIWEVGGVYISPIQPNDISDGVVYILNLLPSGEASLSSDYLDMEPALFEVGTWTDNGDNSVSVEITGTLDNDYDESILISLTVGEYGQLLAGELPLYPIVILDYLADDTAEDTADDTGVDIGSGESDVYVFVAEVTIPDEDEPVYIYMLLYEDGTVIMTDYDETATIYGEWTLDDDEILSVSMTKDDDTEFDEPVEFVFEFDDDNSLVATEYPVDVFGEEGLIFYAVDDEESSDEAVSEGEFFYFESDVLPIEGTDGIVISLVLSGDGAAMVSTDYQNEEDPYLEFGEWTLDDDGAVIVSINEGPDGVYDDPYVFTFVEDEDDLSLNLVEESIEVFGEAGLVLHRVE